VDLPAAVLVHVQDLTASLGQDDRDLTDTLAALTTALRSTATSYCGFRLTIVDNAWPITLAAFDDGHDVPVGTSLRLPLGLVSRMVDGESRVVFFAGTPGAFTDLAADLSHALGGIPVDGRSSAANNKDHHATHVDGHRRVIELDADLPPLSRVSGLTGLADSRCSIAPSGCLLIKVTTLSRLITCWAATQRPLESSRMYTPRGSSDAECDTMINDSPGSKININLSPPRTKRRSHQTGALL
jgi:hypothetical protein